MDYIISTIHVHFVDNFLGEFDRKCDFIGCRMSEIAVQVPIHKQSQFQ
jgi:hypothetical protein